MYPYGNEAEEERRKDESGDFMSSSEEDYGEAKGHSPQSNRSTMKNSTLFLPTSTLRKEKRKKPAKLRVESELQEVSERGGASSYVRIGGRRRRRANLCSRRTLNRFNENDLVMNMHIQCIAYVGMTNTGFLKYRSVSIRREGLTSEANTRF